MNLMKVELTEGGTFWLSESPSVPGSISWGATAPCIATWAISFCIILLSWYCSSSSKSLNLLEFEEVCCLNWHDVHTFQVKRAEPPGFSFQIVNTNLDEDSPRARRRSALLTWQHIASLPPNLPVIYCGGFNTQKESMTGRFLLGRSRYSWLENDNLLRLACLFHIEILWVHTSIDFSSFQFYC